MPSSNKQNQKSNIQCNTVVAIPFEPEVFTQTVLAHLGVQEASLEFTFFDNASIHEMNKTYLDHDWPTDIITFDLSECDDVVDEKGDALLNPGLGSAERGVSSGATAPSTPAEAQTSAGAERDRKGEALSKQNNFLGSAEKVFSSGATAPEPPKSLEGDLYISVEQAEIQASALGHSLEKELKILIIHGILHLLGYDDHSPEDQTEMDEKQHQIYDLLHTQA
jgi:rRNA maturation RNase YbeY